MPPLNDYHERQETIRSILDSLFGEMDEDNAHLWDRKAYLMLIGLVYDRLVTSQSEIPTNELTALAKILAEGRQAAGRTREKAQSSGVENAGRVSDGPLPRQFRRLVRQVYGANLQDPSASRNDPPPRRARSRPLERKTHVPRTHVDSLPGLPKPAGRSSCGSQTRRKSCCQTVLHDSCRP